MMLCLSNGERIKLSNKMRILFEVMDLNQASPATVSRCGMVWVDDEVVSW
jgi:dynein heavy chain